MPVILVGVLWLFLRLDMLVFVTLVGGPAVLDLDIGLNPRLGIAPGDAEPTVLDGDALHLPHGHLRITTSRELNECVALVGLVDVGDLAEVQKEFPNLLRTQAAVDGADE